jgi:hypothetical protein
MPTILVLKHLQAFAKRGVKMPRTSGKEKLKKEEGN